MDRFESALSDKLQKKFLARVYLNRSQMQAWFDARYLHYSENVYNEFLSQFRGRFTHNLEFYATRGETFLKRIHVEWGITPVEWDIFSEEEEGV